jgi:hypothetical protein
MQRDFGVTTLAIYRDFSEVDRPVCIPLEFDNLQLARAVGVCVTKRTSRRLILARHEELTADTHVNGLYVGRSLQNSDPDCAVQPNFPNAPLRYEWPRRQQESRHTRNKSSGCLGSRKRRLFSRKWSAIERGWFWKELIPLLVRADDPLKRRRNGGGQRRIRGLAENSRSDRLEPIHRNRLTQPLLVPRREHAASHSDMSSRKCDSLFVTNDVEGRCVGRLW